VGAKSIATSKIRCCRLTAYSESFFTTIPFACTRRIDFATRDEAFVPMPFASVQVSYAFDFQCLEGFSAFYCEKVMLPHLRSMPVTGMGMPGRDASLVRFETVEEAYVAPNTVRYHCQGSWS